MTKPRRSLLEAEYQLANNYQERGRRLRLLAARKGDFASLAGLPGVTQAEVAGNASEDEDAIPGGPDDDEEP